MMENTTNPARKLVKQLITEVISASLKKIEGKWKTSKDNDGEHYKSSQETRETVDHWSDQRVSEEDWGKMKDK